jgi:hypothetical protein
VLLRESIYFFFAAQADSARRRLRKLFRDGRVSLAIGLVVLAGAIALAQLVNGPGGGVGEVLHESLLTPSCSTGWPRCRCGSATRPLSRRGPTPSVGGVTGRQPP